jgi:Recombination endonuclease VII
MVSPQAVWQKKRYAEDPEYRKRRLRANEAWRVANKDKVEASRQQRCYGLSTEDRKALLARQGGVCGICKKKGRKLHVDHCHETGKVRGLLCGKCNRGLGHYGNGGVMPVACRPDGGTAKGRSQTTLRNRRRRDRRADRCG